MTAKPRGPLKEADAIAETNAFKKHVYEACGISFALVGKEFLVLGSGSGAVDKAWAVVNALEIGLVNALAGYPLPEFRPLQPKAKRKRKAVSR